MTYSTKNIAEINKVNEQDLSKVRGFTINSISFSSNDDEKGIERKIAIIDSFTEYLLKSIKIETTLAKKDKADLMRILSNLSEQKENLEILIGKKNLSDIEQANKNFSQKTQFPIGCTE
jgi:hypothetical protein